MKKCICPGSFDPITMGHLDIITRGAEMFDEVVICILINTQKKPSFTLDKRIKMILDAVKHLKNVKVDSYDGLLVAYAKAQGASVILRGLRAVSDFENEFAMAAMNHNLDSKIETVFLMTRTEYSFLSSSMVCEVAKLGGDVTGLVPKNVIKNLDMIK